MPNDPQAAINLQKQTVTVSRSNCHNAIGDDLFRLVSAIKTSVAKLAVIIMSHGPKATVRFHEQAVTPPSSNRHHIAGDDLLRPIGVVVECAITKFTCAV